MKELKLEHIKAYPEDLQFTWNENKIAPIPKWTIGYETETDWDNCVYPMSTIKFMIDKQPEEPIGIKLLLHPLSRLTEKIEHNGKKLIPIIELGRHSYSKWLNKKAAVQNLEDCYMVAFSDMIIFKSLSYHPKAMSFESQGIRLNHYDLFHKLFEWKFDIFNLIENGLAKEIKQ